MVWSSQFAALDRLLRISFSTTRRNASHQKDSTPRLTTYFSRNGVKARVAECCIEALHIARQLLANKQAVCCFTRLGKSHNHYQKRGPARIAASATARLDSGGPEIIVAVGRTLRQSGITAGTATWRTARDERETVAINDKTGTVSPVSLM